MRPCGFTLAEMLMVLAIVGILMAIALPNYLRWRDTSAVREAQTLLLVELNRARTTAKRLNAPQTLTWTSSTFNGRALEGGVTIETTPAPLTYVQPHGTIKADASGSIPTYDITFKRGARSAVVRVGGVFGRAILKPVN